ncbi:hypothetical protein Lser_V15G25231 [Lactuca serriola]
MINETKATFTLTILPRHLLLSPDLLLNRISLVTIIMVFAGDVVEEDPVVAELATEAVAMGQISASITSAVNNNLQRGGVSGGIHSPNQWAHQQHNNRQACFRYLLLSNHRPI